MVENFGINSNFGIGSNSLFQEFKKYLVRERIAEEDIVDEYATVFLDRRYSFENIADDMYDLASFLWEKFTSRHPDLKDVRFETDLDLIEYKYFYINAVIKIGGYEAIIERFLCKYGEVASTPEEFHEELGAFLSRVEKGARELVRIFKLAEHLRPSPEPKWLAVRSDDKNDVECWIVQGKAEEILERCDGNTSLIPMEKVVEAMLRA